MCNGCMNLMRASYDACIQSSESIDGFPWPRHGLSSIEFAGDWCIVSGAMLTLIQNERLLTKPRPLAEKMDILTEYLSNGESDLPAWRFIDLIDQSDDFLFIQLLAIKYSAGWHAGSITCVYYTSVTERAENATYLKFFIGGVGVPHTHIIPYRIKQ